MSKEKDKIFRTLEHIAITFDTLGYSPTIPIFKGHQDFEWLFKLELDTIKALCNQQDQRIAELEEQLANSIRPKFKFMEKVWHINKDYFYKKDWFVEELLINGFEYKIDKRKNALVMWYSTYFNDYKNYKYQEKDLFAIKEEAQAKLEELRGK